MQSEAHWASGGGGGGVLHTQPLFLGFSPDNWAFGVHFSDLSAIILLVNGYLSVGRGHLGIPYLVMVDQRLNLYLTV